jgi:uncharacterized protein YjbI with pentapeptide repeats
MRIIYQSRWEIFTLKNAALVFLLLAVMALEAVGAEGPSGVPMQVIDAEEILEKIQRGEAVEYDHVVVRGDLNLSRVHLHRNITTSIRINDSIFDGEVSFNGTTLEQPINHWGSNFAGDVYFRGSTFRENAEFGGATFRGHADFKGTTFSKRAYFKRATFSEGAHFVWITFRGEAHFEGTTFGGDAEFTRATFKEEANFEGAMFSGNARFVGCTFSGYAGFRESTFSGNANFGGANFGGDKANFEGANFGGGEANFERAIFSGDAYFPRSTFSSNVDFWKANFSVHANFEKTEFKGVAIFEGANFGGGEANFKRAIFSGDADFIAATFSRDANFWQATFSGNVYFRLVTFGDNAVFEEATFNEDSDFRRAIFTGDSTFEEAEFNGNVEFGDARFENETSFYRILFERPAYFENCSIESLNLTKADFSRLHLRWDDIKSLHFDEAAYLALIKNYNNLGWYGDANDCYYDYRNAVRENWQAASSTGIAARISNLLDRLIDFGEWLLYGYGVRPFFPIAWSVGIILAFGLFFWRKSCLRKIIVEERIEDSKDASNEVLVKTTARRAEIGALDPILFSLFTFTSGFTSFLHPAIEYKLERCMRWAIFERLLGPFFMALVITAISKTYLIR